MSKRTIAYLKAAFGLLKKPREQDFGDIFDSYVHKDDLETVNNAAIDLRINAFNTNLRGVTPGQIDTLGDVLQAFVGFPDTGNLKSMLDAATGQGITWDKVTGRPSNVAVSWGEQIAVFSWAATVPNVVLGDYGNPISMKSYLGLASGVKTLITDISVGPYIEGVQGGYRTRNIIYSVTFAVSPKISLT